ncbi:HD domain-containing protein [Chloroflexia bacterium SDU3-3]|nr:HD domain-containing protein [Chloroflexia bacterium SDU3-3]
MSTLPHTTSWEPQFEQFLLDRSKGFDAAHDLEHIRRVVTNARTLAMLENAELAVVIPAAWLHDCVVVPKNSPLRANASALAAQAAVAFLQSIRYPAEHLPAIRHAIEAHSFSANIPPRSREAKVVQDADRLDALGAVGVARCLMLSGALGRRLYDPAEPFPLDRPLDDQVNTLDHFYVKLFQLADRMNTASGRAEAAKRTAFMCDFLDQLKLELSME